MAQGMAQAQATEEAMKFIAAQRGGLGLATLLNTGWADYNQILADLHNQTLVNTVTEEAYNRTHDTAVNTWARLRQTIQATAIVVGMEMLPSLTGLMNLAIGAATAVEHFAAAHAKLIGPLLATVTAVSGVVGVALLLGGAIALATPAISAIGGVLLGSSAWVTTRSRA